ncbi:MAG: carbohydrate ABC transporter permease [Ruminococcaceae bacterium]|nr:carbohydrate ABC transporter permease [Oscillospiraceae bacterium]
MENIVKIKKKSASNKIKRSSDDIAVDLIGGILLFLCGFVAILPFIMIAAGSVSNEKEIIATGYSVLPKGFTLDAYKYLFSNADQVINGYKVTVFVSFFGTFLSLNIITMASFVLYRKDFKARNVISFFFYFTTLFNGGMVATYIFAVRYLGIKDNLIALFLPHMFNVFYTIVMRSFMTTTVPTSIIESAKIDGANDLKIYFRIVLPLLKPALASVGMFIFLSYWNDWSNSMLYINSSEKVSIQYLLYKTLGAAANYERVAAAGDVALSVELPTETFKLAMTVVTILPIVFVYPFVQKYFVRGITVGAVKG